MRELRRLIFRCALVLMAIGLGWHVQPAAALCVAGPYDPPLFIRGTPAAGCLRYYAPYALLAAAAYVDVAELDGTLRNFRKLNNPFERGGDPALNGEDVEVAIADYRASSVPETMDRARKYLRAWQYQFGYDKYLRCYDTSDTNCNTAYNASGIQSFGDGPAFQVWARTSVYRASDGTFHHAEHEACSEVSIAFRGTRPTFFSDLETNAEPITSGFNTVRSFVTGRNYETDDYYHQLRRNIDTIMRRIKMLECYKKAAHHQIVSVGHSLGGGLAQFAALAIANPDNPRIAKVFAFDSSPVTAAGLIAAEVRDGNVKGVDGERPLEIDRVYQSGEFLSKLVSPVVAPFQYPKSSSTCDPLVRSVAVDLVSGGNTFDLHALRGGSGLAAQMVNISYQVGSPYSPPAGIKSCPTRYSAPQTEDDTVPVQTINPADQTVYAPSGVPARVGRSSRYATPQQFAAQWTFSSPAFYPEPVRTEAMLPSVRKGKRIHTAHL
jgi:hypothetical protein